MTLENLNARLAALDFAQQPPEKRVVLLESSPETPYKVYFQVLGAISGNGGIVALAEEED